ncbi:unnamed protein product [Blepharisma stoltei]|uniref:Phosphatidylethanolamine N-methyltransferase n=1 Tax=Blepharisma stoltei TaxID=1481888 RepID=A0AAU9JDY2_9CILI|nr:unnamed protein product [Blepharisma stoltei]
MDLINLRNSTLYYAAGMMALNPIAWNILAQVEYRWHLVSTLFGNQKKVACFATALLILFLNAIRTTLFHQAIDEQPKLAHDSFFTDILAYLLIGIGQMFVWTSFYRLGFFATFLGDYFGIFTLSEPVTAFPYSVCGDPMYWGSSISYLGYAVLERSMTGLVLTVVICIIYYLAILVESRMLYIIYSEKNKKGN